MATDSIRPFLQAVAEIRRLPLDEQEAQIGALTVAYGTKLKGLPEAAYLYALNQEYATLGGIPVSVLNERIEGRGLSTRVNGALCRPRNVGFIGELVHIGNLVQRSEADLLKLKNFGRGSLAEVKESLEELYTGLGLGLKIPYVHPTEIPKVKGLGEVVIQSKRGFGNRAEENELVKELLLMERNARGWWSQYDLWSLHPALTMGVGLDIDSL